MSADEFNNKFKVGSFPGEAGVPEDKNHFLHLQRLENYVKKVYDGVFKAFFYNGIGYTLEFQKKPTKKQLKMLEHLNLELTDY